VSRTYRSTLAAQEDLNWDGLADLDEDEAPPLKIQENPETENESSKKTTASV
tara:strand:- start:2 stop:157 length:156 start_codon:yes stop_codon:yes gene_type:complete